MSQNTLVHVRNTSQLKTKVYDSRPHDSLSIFQEISKSYLQQKLISLSFNFGYITLKIKLKIDDAVVPVRIKKFITI